MKHKHYSPKADVILVEGNIPDIIGKVKELAEFYTREGKKIGILATDETQTAYPLKVVKALGSRFDLATVARNLFRLVREFDAENVDIIIAEGVSSEGLGLAVMNRLRKASGYHIVKAK
jgi:L-threonylcarbamoyladenylate synthase